MTFLAYPWGEVNMEHNSAMRCLRGKQPVLAVWRRFGFVCNIKYFDIDNDLVSFVNYTDYETKSLKKELSKAKEVKKI